MASDLTQELAGAAARLVVEEGMEYGQAKRRAAKALGRHRPGELPSNDAVEEEVRAYIELFCSDTQPAELAALRRLALVWLHRLAEFRPHLTGAVWRGTATRLSNLHVDLYCDDSKAAEIGLINRGVDFDVDSRSRPGGGEPLEVLVLSAPCRELNEDVTLFLHVRDLDDLRGGLKPDSQGRTSRGDAASLERLLHEQDDHGNPEEAA